MEVELSFKKLQFDVCFSLTNSKNSIGESSSEPEGQLITQKIKILSLSFKPKMYFCFRMKKEDKYKKYKYMKYNLKKLKIKALTFFTTYEQEETNMKSKDTTSIPSSL